MNGLDPNEAIEFLPRIETFLSFMDFYDFCDFFIFRVQIDLESTMHVHIDE